MPMIDVPVGSNFITDYFIGSAIAVDGARSLYHLTKMYNIRNQLAERQRHILFSFGEIGLLIGNYFAVRKYVDSKVEIYQESTFKSSSPEANAILFANIAFIYTPLVIKSILQYRDDLPTQDKIIDLIADISIIGLMAARQTITDEMIKNFGLCSSGNVSIRPADCPAPSVMNAYSFTL